MSEARRQRMTARFTELVLADEDRGFTAQAMHRGATYGLETLRRFGARFGSAVLMGKLGITSVQGVARYLGVPDALVDTLLQQSDGRARLNFFAEAVLRTQAGELALDLAATRDPRLVVVRTQPTSPLRGVHKTHRGEEVHHGISKDRLTTTYDCLYYTYVDPVTGVEQCVGLGGLAAALEKDREAARAGVDMSHLSALQYLSLEHPTKAMFVHSGLVKDTIEPEIPGWLNVGPYVFLQGRYEGREESIYAASPTRTVSIVGEEGYQEAAREALGDEVDIVVEAEGVSPLDPGLERRHDYVTPDGKVAPNEAVRELIRRNPPSRFEPSMRVDHRGVGLMLMRGDLLAPLSDGQRREGGQALLKVTAHGEPRWFVLLNKRNGARAWDCSRREKREKLQQLVESFALLEASDSTAGTNRRDQYMAQENYYNLATSHACARENVWRQVSMVRQSRFGDVPLAAPTG